METAIKTTIAKKNSEMEKLEQSKKTHLRMITSSAAKLRLKYGKVEEQENFMTETEARKIRMYETHNPGFCYLRNGEYRRKSTHNSISANPDPIQCSEKIKAILFSDNELDICKTMCLHLLGTHIQNKNHIQRKDGRLCSYIKAQVGEKSVPNTLQSVAQRKDTYSERPTKYDTMLPRYILDVKLVHRGVSTTSVKLSELDSGSDDESKKKRKLLVPIFINSEIRTIINSVMEALEAVESSKLKDLTELAKSPEELRDMLSKEETQEFITELAKNPLVMKPTSYDFVMAHLMFDKIPDKGTLETVAQVLEVFDDSELRESLHQIRRGILYRHLQLTNPNLIQRKKNCVTEKIPPMENNKTSNPTVNPNVKSTATQSVGGLSTEAKQDPQEDAKSGKSDAVKVLAQPFSEKENKTDFKNKFTIKLDLEKTPTEKSSKEQDDSSDDESYQQRRNSTESTKCDLHNLTNSQRILLGLKVASLKSRPINMHQFEGKKKVDIAAIINPIIRPQVCDIDYKQNSPANHLRNFALVTGSTLLSDKSPTAHQNRPTETTTLEKTKLQKKFLTIQPTIVFSNAQNAVIFYLGCKIQLLQKAGSAACYRLTIKQCLTLNCTFTFAQPERKVKNTVCKISTISTTDLENLTRALLAKLRLEISDTENKKRVNEFMAKI